MQDMMKIGLNAVMFLVTAATTLANDKLFKYLPENAVMTGYANARLIHGNYVGQQAGELNKLISARNFGAYDFSGVMDKFDSALVATDRTMSAESQMLLLNTTLPPEDFFTILEESSKCKLLRRNIQDHTAAIFPPQAVNKKLRNRIQVAVIYLTDNIVYIGNLAQGEKLLTAPPEKSDATPPVFADLPSDAFAMVTAVPGQITVLAPFFGGLEKITLAAQAIDDGHGVRIIGSIPCDTPKTAQQLAVNLRTLAITMLPALMRNNMALGRRIATALTTSSNNSEVKIEWLFDKKLTEEIFNYSKKLAALPENSQRVE